MKPHEFWDSTYREVALYVESRSFQYEQEEKSQILLAENLGNKLIGSGMTAKKPKNINLIKDIYPEFFEKELTKQNAFERKASEGEELVNLMLELTEELKQKTEEKE
ncbi:MAG: hypothetical protein HFI86_05895 [Bacilli bacterium]|nr:hypothetical protein [Bacilli bacterium]